MALTGIISVEWKNVHWLWMGAQSSSLVNSAVKIEKGSDTVLVKWHLQWFVFVCVCHTQATSVVDKSQLFTKPPASLLPGFNWYIPVEWENDHVFWMGSWWLEYSSETSYQWWLGEKCWQLTMISLMTNKRLKYWLPLNTMRACGVCVCVMIFSHKKVVGK